MARRQTHLRSESVQRRGVPGDVLEVRRGRTAGDKPILSQKPVGKPSRARLERRAVRLSPEEKQKQEYYRDARTGGYYGKIWQNVGKCVFCDLREKYIVTEENGMVLTVALFAYIDGNVMIMPRRHVRSVKELTAEEWQTARKLMYIAKKLIRKVHGIRGVQYVLRDGGIVAQSTVSDHLHIHVVPFDAPDLSVWNYRQLRYTPLENAELFRKQEKKIAELGKRFEEKYGDD